MFIPFPIKAKVLFPITIIVSLYLGFSGSGGILPHFAHIGGALVGYILIKVWVETDIELINQWEFSSILPLLM